MTDMKKIIFTLTFYIYFLNSFGQWTSLNSGVANWLGSPFFLNPDTGYVIGSNGIILQTFNAGIVWDTVQSNTTKGLRKLVFTDSNTGFIIGESGTFLKTTDGGNTWLNLTFQQSHLYDISFVSSQVGFVIGANGAVYKTTNGGLNWTNISVSLNSWFTCHFFSSSKGFIGGINDMRVTNDGGNTWTQINQGQFYYIYDNYFLNDSIGYLLELRYFGRSLIYKTSNGGITWTDSTEIVKGQIENIFFINANVGYAVGGNSTGPSNSSLIFKTINGGTTWSQQNSGVNSILSSVFFTNQNTGYIAGANGTILKTQNGGVGLQEISNSNKIKIYPNPITDEQIKLEGISSESIIEIFDNLGKMLVRLKNKNSIDLNEYSKGIYFLRITQPEGLINYKVIKQ
jgi:photosystem II stability/assembly factor-like uncharacterized protein